MKGCKFSLICVPLFMGLCSAQDPVVEIAQGILKGRIEIDRKGGTFYSFQSVPYAKPPIGSLRFKAPQEADGWDGVREATEDVPSCYQRDAFTQAQTGQEDCLYLNVYTPNLSTDNLRPVMVFIHGGGFTIGSAARTMYGPEFLIAEDVVLVTINYRLGLFGIFSIDDEELGFPGNAGMKDQVMALRWIKDNVRLFGGNPDDVTIFGESAGGISVHGHIISPMSKGLFHKAISESGVATMTMERVRNSGLLLAELLGVPTGNLSVMVESLQDIPAPYILLGQDVLVARHPGIPLPISEILSNEPSFLTGDILTSIKTGNYNHVPYIIGYNDAEGIYYDVMSRLLTGQPPLITDFSTVIPYDLGIINGTEEAAYLSEKIKRFYYGDSEPSTDDMQPYIQLLTDFTFGFPSYRAAVEHEKTAETPIYFYRFSADTELNFLKKFHPGTAEHPGAAHMEEIGYLFRNALQPQIEINSVEDIAIGRMVTLWANFAKYDNPTPEHFTDFKWEPVSESKFNYLDVGTYESTMGVDPDYENMKFWTSIYDEFFIPKRQTYKSKTTLA